MPSVSAWLGLVETTERNSQANERLLDLPRLSPSPANDLNALASIVGQHPSSFVRMHAARVLGEFTEAPEITIPALAAGLADPDELVRAHAVAALIRHGGAAQPALWAAAQDWRTIDRGLAIGEHQKHTHPLVSDYALVALAHLPELDAMPMFETYREALRRGAWRQVVAAPLASAKRTSADIESSFDFEMLESASGQPGSIAHLQAAICYVTRALSPDSIRRLAPLIADEDPKMRELIRSVLRSAVHASAALDSVRSRLRVADDDESAALTTVLAAAGEGAVRELLDLRRSHRAAKVRQAAIKALARSAAVSLDDYVGGFEQETDVEARQLWVNGLEAQLGRREPGSQNLPRLAELFSAALRDSRLQTEAARVLVNEIDRLAPEIRRRLVPGLMAIVTNASPEAATPAINVLVRIGPDARDAMPTLRSLLDAQATSSASELRSSALRALAAIGEWDEQTTGVLRRIALDPADRLSSQAARMIGQRVQFSVTTIEQQVQSIRTSPGRYAPRDALGRLAAFGPLGHGALEELCVDVTVAPERRNEAFEVLVAESTESAARAAWARRLAARQKDSLLQTNIDLVMIRDGTPEERAAAGQRLLAELKRRPELSHRAVSTLVDIGFAGTAEHLLERFGTRPSDDYLIAYELERMATLHPESAPVITQESLRRLPQLRGDSRGAGLELLRKFRPADVPAAAQVIAKIVGEETSGVVSVSRYGVREQYGNETLALLGLRILQQWGPGAAGVLDFIKGLTRTGSAKVRAEALKAIATIAPKDAGMRSMLLAIVRVPTHEETEVVQAALAGLRGQEGVLGDAFAVWAAATISDYLRREVREWLDEFADEVRPPILWQTSARISRLPAFPWPPPPYANIGVFGQDFARELLGAADASLGDVHLRLLKALHSVDESFVSGLFDVSGGFVLLTRFERIDREGKPLPGNRRWVEGRVTPHSLADLIARFIFEPSGYFRTLAFVFTDQSNFQPDPDHELPKASQGGQLLPPEIAGRKLADCHAYLLVYCVERKPGGETRFYSDLGAPIHLRESGMAPALR